MVEARAVEIMPSFCYLGSNQLMNAKLLVFNYYCQLKQWGRLQRRVGGGSLSGGEGVAKLLNLMRTPPLR